MYLPLDEESLEDSDNETLAAEAKEVVCWLGMCGEADRLRGFGVATKVIIKIPWKPTKFKKKYYLIYNSYLYCLYLVNLF